MTSKGRASAFESTRKRVGTLLIVAAVVRNTFYGTIPAVKYRKQFLVSMNEKIKNRVVSLLHSAGLEERTFGDIELLEDEIDYRGVEKRLRSKIELSAEFLSRHLPWDLIAMWFLAGQVESASVDVSPGEVGSK